MALLLIALLAFGTLLGAASYANVTLLLVAAAVIGGWLAVFGLREYAARHKRGLDS
jgi:hypothetical protein